MEPDGTSFQSATTERMGAITAITSPMGRIHSRAKRRNGPGVLAGAPEGLAASAALCGPGSVGRVWDVGKAMVSPKAAIIAAVADPR
jgi:hypothetical protein